MPVVFKPNYINQGVLFPLDLNEKVGKNHACRVIHEVVSNLDISKILKQYKGGGTSSYDPRMLLGILFYGYLNNTYSCRKIAKAIEENIYFMWLSGGQTPDFRTINDFRGKKLKGEIDDLFSQIVKMMVQMGLVSLEKQFVDGTKIEANARKYSFVWKKSVENHKEKLEEKIKSVLGDIKTAIQADDAAPVAPENVAIDSNVLAEEIAKINEKIRASKVDTEVKKQLKDLTENKLPKLTEYENKLKTLGERNSYAKTDTDATFMRMKDDHMGNGQLKAGYNIQISTENQIITYYSVHQNRNDYNTLGPHLAGFEQQYGKQSIEITADAGYGNEENYDILSQKGIEYYIPYANFRKEQSKKFKGNPFHPQNLFYNAELDFLVCPMGQRMEKKYVKRSKTDNGFEQMSTIYEAKNCEGCPLRAMCHKSKQNRQIAINHKLNDFKATVKERLMSEEGKEIYKKRCIEPEPVFGNLKQNKGFRRFTLRSIPKVNIEFGLYAIAHNFAKYLKMASEMSINNFFDFLDSLFCLFYLHRSAKTHSLNFNYVF
jgi:transposase